MFMFVKVVVADNLEDHIVLHACSTVHWVSVPGEDSDHFCPCVIVSELTRKTQHSQALGGTMLYSRREETEQDQRE